MQQNVPFTFTVPWKPAMLTRILLFSVLWLGPVADLRAQNTEKSNKYALLIGIDAPELLPAIPSKYSEASVVSLSKVLSESGYEVETLIGEQATLAAIHEKLDGVTKKSNSEGVVVVGYFGFGMELKEKGYLLSVDTTVAAVTDSNGRKLYGASGDQLLIPNIEQAISVDSVLEKLAISKASNRIFICDAAREEPNRARGFDGRSDFCKIPNGTAVLFGCSAGEQTLESDELHDGIFAHMLIRVLREQAEVGETTMGIIGDRVRKLVSDWMRKNAPIVQHPRLMLNGSVDMQLSSGAKQGNKRGVPLPSSDGYVFTSPIGRYESNSIYLYDMHGNVWESCQDAYDGKAYTNRRDTVKDAFLEKGSDRVNRGGSWLNAAVDCRSAHRFGYSPVYRNVNLGFRVSLQSVRKP